VHTGYDTPLSVHGRPYGALYALYSQRQVGHIELFNRGTSSVSLAGMSVQYAATTGSTWSITALPAVTLAPGQYFLIQESGGANGAALPPARFDQRLGRLG